ncbi:MAG TPA: twin-arginine translocase TatA/TatE family subunit, partial [Steroidobacteraceae bacterium]|nr:twin-arginine translocase TatA/TatE family subunit [Steroidobacteraceae bacterium]
KVFENLSLPHLLMVVAVAMLVFGPKRIPEIGGSMGKAIREFRKNFSGTGVDDLPVLSDAPPLPAKAPGAASDVATVPVEGSEPKRLLN